MHLKLISLLKEKIGNSTFVKSVALIAGGTAFAQVLSVILSPIITRIYPPDQYGVLTTYTALLGLLSISSSLDYQNAIPIAEDDNIAFNLLTASMLILSAMSLVILILVMFLGEYFLQLFDSEILYTYKYFIPVGVFFTGIYNIVLQWGFRERNYQVITRTKINQSIASNFTKVILGLTKFGSIGLILGTIIGQSAGITSLSMPIMKKRKLLSSIKQIKYVMKRYKNFPFYSTPNNFISIAVGNFPALLLTSIFGTHATGLFGLANSITHLPMSLIGNSVSQVFYSEVANIGKSEPLKIKYIAKKLIKKIALIALIPFVVLLFFGPWLFSFVFGSEWYDAGIYSRILSFMIYFGFIVTPVGRILEIFERQKDSLLFNIIRLSSIIIIFIIVKELRLNSFQAVALYSITNSFLYIAMLIMIRKILNQEIERINKERNNSYEE